MEIFSQVLQTYNLPQEAIVLLPSMKNREELKELLEAKEYVDLLIPRGWEWLISVVSQYAKVPIIKHDKGVCHIFAHHSFKIEQSIEVIINA